MRNQTRKYYIDSTYIQNKLKKIIKKYEGYMLQSTIDKFEGYKFLKEIENLQGELYIEHIIMTTRPSDDRSQYNEKYTNTNRLLNHISDYIHEMEFETGVNDNE